MRERPERTVDVEEFELSGPTWSRLRSGLGWGSYFSCGGLKRAILLPGRDE